MSESEHYILVVDDLQDQADSLVELLGMWGHAAVARYGGVAALAAARAGPPAAVLLDLGMPRMDGFEFVARLRELPGCGTTPVVAVTAYETLVSQAQEAGVADYLLKPVEPGHLFALVERLAAGRPVHFTAGPRGERRTTRTRRRTLRTDRRSEVPAC